MCGRYASFLPPDLIARLFGTTNPRPNVRPTWNMAPTMSAPVVRRQPESGERHLDLLTWGLVPSFTKDLKTARKPVNARAETVAASGMFRTALAKRRCLVPAAAFYEWKTTPDGQGAACHRAGGWQPAGLRRHLGGVAVAGWGLHDRMPVILEAEDWPVWLGEVEGDPQALLKPAKDGILRIWPVDKRVGNVRNDGPDLIEPEIPPEPDTFIEAPPNLL